MSATTLAEVSQLANLFFVAMFRKHYITVNILTFKTSISCLGFHLLFGVVRHLRDQVVCYVDSLDHGKILGFCPKLILLHKIWSDIFVNKSQVFLS